jgi:addiction module HigA family antidote
MDAVAFQPDYAVPPGSVLAEHLETKGLSQAAFARLCGRSPKMISEIIAGKAPVEPATALQFEKVLGMKAVIWLGIESDYRLHLARKQEAEQTAGLLGWAKEFPLSTLRQAGAVPKGRVNGNTVSHLLAFFGVASDNAWNAKYARLEPSFRHSPSFKSKAKHVATWIRMGEIQAYTDNTGSYDRELFKENLCHVRSLTRSTSDSTFQKAKSLCAQAGVSIVFVPCLPGVPISGAAYWLGRSRPVIQLSGRYKTDDHFWFTLFHEAAHILFDTKKSFHLDVDVRHDMNDTETKANKWASDFLVNPSDWRSFVALHQFTESDVQSFCASVEIAPGIVVGRLQHEKHLDWHELNHMKFKIDSLLHELSTVDAEPMLD